MARSVELRARAAPAGIWTRARGAVARRVLRARKIWWQRRHLDPTTPRRGVFLVGCQRSGTNMFHQVVGAAPDLLVYNEDARPAFHDFRLRETARIEQLIRRSSAPVVLFKPLCDSHRIDQILDAHPGSTAIWIYRRYGDVVNSMLHMWGSHQRDCIDALVERRFDALGWRGERLSEAVQARVREVYRDDLGDHEAGVLMWLMRNHFFFELDLERDPRVLLVRYEDLVHDPQAGFASVFRFLGMRFDPAWVEGVKRTSVDKEPFADLSAPIAALADDLLERLDRAFERQRAPVEPASPAS